MFRSFGKFFHHIICTVLDFFYPLVQRILPREVYYYLACGTLNTLQDWVLYFLLFHYVVAKRFLSLGFVTLSPHIASLLLVTPITFLFGFCLSKYITFRGSEIHTFRQMVRYGLIYAINFLLTYVCLKVLVEVLNVYPTPAKMLTTVITTLVSFLMQKYYTFHRQHDTTQQQ